MVRVFPGIGSIQRTICLRPLKRATLLPGGGECPWEKTLVAGPLLRKPFYRGNDRFDRSEVIKDLGLDPRLPIYLLGNRSKWGEIQYIPVIKALNQAQIDCQILALCGRKC